MHGMRTARIKAILGKRESPVRQLKETADRLDVCRQAVAELEHLRGQLATDAPADVTERLGSLRLREFEGRLALLTAEVRRLHTRFGRETLNIGVVGLAGQGKSTLLKALTGLGEAEIPTSSRDHCTGVACRFINQEGPISGELDFHDEQSLLHEAIALYYRELNLGFPPASLEEFRSRPLPSLPETRRDALSEETLGHLSKYRDHFPAYRDHLNGPRRVTVGRDDLRRFVAQLDERGQPLYDWLAVREARIVCRFPAPDVGPITFVDTPGMGNTSLGDLERIFRVLREEVDFVLFVRHPEKVFRKEPRDFQLYDLACKALAPLSLPDCSLMAINRFGDNSENCKSFEDKLAANGIRVTHRASIDCSDGDAVRTQVLDWVVDFLANRIEDLDRAYLAATNAELARLHQELRAELDRATDALGCGQSRADESKVFRPLFKSFWNDLAGRLECLVKELQNQRDNESAELRKVVQDAQAEAEAVVVPSTEEVDRRANAAGSLDKAYYGFMNEYRTSLSRHFLTLDEGLKQGIERVKECVANELAKTVLGGMTQERGSRFLARLQQEATAHGHQLASAIDYFIRFDLSYRGLIQHRIRKHLDVLTPDLTSLKLPQRPNAAQVRSGLETAYRGAVYGIGQSLQDILVEPSQAAFAVVEEFVDAVLRAEGAEDEWYFVIEDLRADLWKTEFDALGERSRRRQQWQAGVDRARQSARLETFRINP